MKYLLDTHVVLWTIGQSKRLPQDVATAICDTDNDVFVSAVTFWEIAIKVRTGKLDIGDHKPWELPKRAVDMGLITVSLSPEGASSMGQLDEETHFDPFDRMLIWQAVSRNLTLVSGDKEFSRFKKDGLKMFWI